MAGIQRAVCKPRTPVELRPRVSGYIDPRCLHGLAHRVKERPAVVPNRSAPVPSGSRTAGSRSVRAACLTSNLPRPTRGRAPERPDQRARPFSREEYERQGRSSSLGAGSLGFDRCIVCREARLNREFTEVAPPPIDGHVSRAIITAGNLVTSASPFDHARFR